MGIDWGDVPLGTVLAFPWTSHDAGTGANEATSGLALTDIEVYKGVSLTQRASDNGYGFLGGDADGIELDGYVGLNGIQIDTGDNSDASFFVAGSFYWVMLGNITIDGQTVNTILGTFRLVAAESVAGVREVDVTHVAGTAQTAGDLKASLNTIDDFLDTEVQAIKDKTDNLPSDPADASVVAGLIAAVEAKVDTIDGIVDAILVDTGTTLDGLIQDLPTNAELATSQAAADDATLAAIAALNNLSQANVRTAVGLGSANLDTQLDALPTNAELATALGTADDAVLAAIAALWTTALTESYNADGAAPTPAQALFVIMQMLTEMSISGTAMTIKKLDGTTTAFTLTLDAATPTSVTRAT